MRKSNNEATLKLVDGMISVVKLEREEATRASRELEAEELRSRYRSTIRTINKLTERDAGKLLRTAFDHR